MAWPLTLKEAAAWRAYVARTIVAHAGCATLPPRERICNTCPIVLGVVHKNLALALLSEPVETRLALLRTWACVVDPTHACRTAWRTTAPHELDAL